MRSEEGRAKERAAVNGASRIFGYEGAVAYYFAPKGL